MSNHLYNSSQSCHISNIRLNMNRLEIEWPRKLLNRKQMEVGNTEIMKDLEIEIHCKFGIHENRIKRQQIKQKKEIRELKNQKGKGKYRG